MDFESSYSDAFLLFRDLLCRSLGPAASENVPRDLG